MHAEPMHNNKEIQARLLRGLLNLIILQFLQEEPSHGYQLIVKIRKTYGVYFGPSTVYPLLNLLEKEKLIEGSWEISNGRPRKIYDITKTGKRLIETTEDLLRLIRSKMEA